ncbi:hypothetical protein GCM10010965_01180 [Caldalkalibacillus thermarum]|uniref:hypothetical protein n=1 Tax=Caldalkalibacillus thermarum TaxID=296745 RepID=UPI00166A19FF|nr:hypothetical protein [Caldalkalibacillus thermarum]GGK11991.1 hypothetical protein GCM10010965_01180 [Caldalkalibacillus thermarum]
MNKECLDRELEELERDLSESLSKYQVKPASASDTHRLLINLEEELDRDYTASSTFNEENALNRERPSLWRFCRSQLHICKWPLWIVSIAVFAMLTLISDPSRPSLLYIDQPFVHFVPLFVLIGALYHYQTWNKAMRLVEMITPYPPALLLYSRLLIVLAINLGLGLISTFYWAFRVEAFALHTFLLSWIAPALFLLGVLAYVLFWKGIKTGFTVAFILWAALAAHPYLINDPVKWEALLVAGHVCLLIAGIGLLWLAYKRGLTQYRFNHLLLD